MKKLFLIISFLLCIKLSFPQDDGRYVFNSKSELKYSLFLGPELKVSRMIEGYQLYTGIKGAILLNDKIVFGLSGGGFVTETIFMSLNDQGDESILNTIMGYGGFYLDYIIPSRLPVQVSFPTVIGAAGVALFSKLKTNGVIADEEMVEGGVFFIYEPGINLEVNLTKFLRMGFGAGYRLAVKGDMDRVSARDLSDFTFNWNLKFGFF
jgi:hypothetical protein